MYVDSLFSVFFEFFMENYAWMPCIAHVKKYLLNYKSVQHACRFLDFNQFRKMNIKGFYVIK